MHDLVHLVKKYLQPGVLSGSQMVERVILGWYLWSLPNNLQWWMSHGDPKTVDQLVEMVDKHTMVEDLLGSAKSNAILPAWKIKLSANLGTSTQESQGVI